MVSAPMPRQRGAFLAPGGGSAPLCRATIAPPAPPFNATLTYEAVTKGGGVSSPPGLCVYRRREEVYHYTHGCGGCVGTTYMGSPRVDTCALWYSCIFFQKNRVFEGVPKGPNRPKWPKLAKMTQNDPKWAKMIKNA